MNTVAQYLVWNQSVRSSFFPKFFGLIVCQHLKIQQILREDTEFRADKLETHHRKFLSYVTLLADN